jgi:DNA-directed RNA polymerase specialized sigma24 family protein
MLEILTREEKCETHKISWWAKWMFVRLHHRALRNAREVPVKDMESYMAAAPASQFNYAAARQAERLLKFLPNDQRKIMELTIDGANPLEISDETRMPITKVLDLLRDARKWLADGGAYLDTSAAVCARF